jgi:trimeric autotransporter adhesin
MEIKFNFPFMALTLFIWCMIFVYPSSGLAAPYITINPVSDHTIGDVITITGTTNLPVNTTLIVQAGPKVFTNYEQNYFFKTVNVSRGNGINEWSVLMNTSTFSADDYNLTIDRVEGSSLMNTTRFTMNPEGTRPGTTVDPSLTSFPITQTMIKNQTGTSDSVIPPSPKPSPLPETVSFIALGFVMVIVSVEKDRGLL